MIELKQKKVKNKRNMKEDKDEYETQKKDRGKRKGENMKR